MHFAFPIFKYFPYGGIQRDMMKVAREMVRRGHRITIFTLRWQAPDLDEAGIEVEVMPVVGLTRHDQYDRFAEDVNKAVRAGSFDQVMGFNKMAGLDVYYAGDSCYIEKANTQRSAWYRLLPRYKSFFAAEKAVFDVHSTTEILCISDVEVPRYRHHYRTAAERFHTLPPGIERDRIAPPNLAAVRQEFRDELQIAADELMLLFVGSGFIKKGLDRALLAVAALPLEIRRRVKMFVIGRDKADAFERMAMRLGLKNQITFYSEGRDDVPSFLFSADALLHPAYDEAAGMVIIEAMLAGLPALVTKDCGYAKYLSDYNAGIVLANPFSQIALNEALVELLTSNERETWAANGLRAAENPALFQMVEQMADKLEAFAKAQKPKLVFCLYRYFPYGGLQRDFMRIALACQQAGYDIVVYCIGWFGDIPAGFKVISVSVPGVVNHVRYQQFADVVAAKIPWQRPQAVIGFNKIPGLDVYYAADPCYAKKAQTMRSGIYRRTQRYKHMSQFEHAVFNERSNTQVMLLTGAQQEDFEAYYQTPSHRMHQLPPGVSRDRRRSDDWQQSRSRVRAEFGVGEQEFLLLLVGSGFITKGLDRALIALAALPEEVRSRTKFLVIGQDNPNAFLRQARQLGVAEAVIVQSGRDDIADVLQAADLMVHPAYMESGGLVLIEAIIAGLPVIATEVCGFAHYITDAQSGCVVSEPFQQAELNQFVSDALADPEQRRLWTESGVSFGREHEELYDMPRHALEIIEGVVSRRQQTTETNT
ncbi:MAG: UDP-glucose:(heptosyl)LPS alpha-1,3-glucosyltransferase [Limisphaerales bacterium]|jgi:UDP-glucose:(heptosyl)LPS alpha-1,3-glucosyltransferase